MRDRYLIKSVAHAARVLEAFRPPGEGLALHEVIERTGLSRGIVFRMLYTLEKCGLIEKTGPNQYRSALGRLPRRRWRIGYAAPGIETSFTTEVTGGLQAAMDKEEAVQLLTLDNQFSTSAAIKNAARFVDEHVDLVIEYQLNEEATGALSAQFAGAGVPVIAINNPIPGATYFGANNYHAGVLGGQALGRWANANWGGSADHIVMLDLKRSTVIGRSRLHGMVAGIRETLRQPPGESNVLFLDGQGQFEKSWEAMRRQLRLANMRRCLVGGINDGAALGAMRAFEESGRAGDCAFCSQNGSLDARTELRRPNTRLLFSVAYFAELYGEGLVRLALDILNRRHVPPAVFTRHDLLTCRNVDHLYPNDSLLAKTS
jgi:ribose transport system substrate-binding protein